MNLTVSHLLADLCARPWAADRLVIADALEESGDAARAEFVRTQRLLFEQASNPCSRCDGDGKAHGSDRPFEWSGPGSYPGPCPVCHGETLRRRERELWMGCRAGYDGLPGHWVPVLDCDAGSICTASGNSYAIYRRGFPAEVRCTLADWFGEACPQCEGRGWYHDDSGGNIGVERHCLACSGTGRTGGHGPAIVQQCPIERVVLTDAVIHQSGGNDTYYVGGLGRFPKEYWSRLDNLPSRAAARAALSAAARDWARAKAGLEPWPKE